MFYIVYTFSVAPVAIHGSLVTHYKNMKCMMPLSLFDFKQPALVDLIISFRNVWIHIHVDIHGLFITAYGSALVKHSTHPASYEKHTN